MKKLFKTTEEYSEMKQKHQTTLEKVSEILGIDAQLSDITGFFNLLKAEVIHNKNLTWSLEGSFQSEIEEISDWVFRKKFFNQTTGKLGSGYLMNRVRRSVSILGLTFY